jgi:hypothetical protein
VVCNPRRDALLKEGSKSDKVDARKLADWLRTGMLHRASTGKTDYGRYASWGRSYQTISKDLTRVMKEDEQHASTFLTSGSTSSIWIPSPCKIVRTRHDAFDEGSRFTTIFV